MKKTLVFIMIVGCLNLNAQNSADKFTTGNSSQTREPRLDQMSFVPNEVLVKFKDEVPLSSAVRLRSAGLSAIDKVLQANGVDSLVRLFPNAKSGLLRSSGVARIVKDPQGRDMKIPNLDKIYKITLPQLRSTSNVPVNIFQVIEDLKALPEVEYAEPNYIYSVDDLQPVGPVLTADDVKKMQSGLRSSQAAVVPNDPLYAQQWYIPAVKADLVWEQTTGDTTQVIGILDTGVDWNHPDLKNKIWTNKGEIPGNGIDDEGNGLIDDVRGWDYINNDNNPMDDNSHGTHVAGIAAAETNNGIGIAGICPKAKIMPIKVFQSTGRGDVATISKGIIYATEKGATVINMSFGSYSNSLAMKDALAYAYATCVLVASAGNDNLPIGPGKFSKCNELNFGFPSYPAALSFVLGVQSPEACFSNYDQDGPEFSAYSDLLNYEMKAPGTNILSAIPNGSYRIFMGTSMAAPIVSGAVCLYMSKRFNDSQELMWGNLINSIDSYIDINRTINIIPTPKLMFVSKTVVDTLVGDDKNGIINAGETIQLWFNIRNTWGQCDSVIIDLKLGEFEDSTVAEIITSSSLIGSVSPYSCSTNQQKPFKIHVNSNVAHNRDILLEASLNYPNSKDTIRQNVVLNISNGIELSGVMDSTLILNSSRQYLVNKSFKIGENGHLILCPGTKLLNKVGIICNGKITGLGTNDSLIIIDGPGGFYSSQQNASANFAYTIFQNQYRLPDFENWVGFGFRTSSYYKCRFTNIVSYSMLFRGSVTIKECILDNSNCGTLFYDSNDNSIVIENNNFVDSRLMSGLSYQWNNSIDLIKSLKYNTFSNIDNLVSYYGKESLFCCKSSLSASQYGNNFIGFGRNRYITYVTANSSVNNMPNQYWGTIDKNKIKLMNWNFWDDATLAELTFNPILTAPSDSTHGVVWKVLINGKDAQDEFVDPVGVGPQRFDVYFNRVMDKKFTPQISFGVRYPYSQQSVSENGSWSEDGKIFTVYKKIKLTTGDGLNRVRVTGAKDLEGWEIPTEDMRFEFLISAASSSSLDFMATPGLGKVKLEWNNNNLADGLGYNMYRMEHINDSTLTAPVIINTTLISDTLYTDYSVTPNKKYYYFYKIVRTNLFETDSSKVVSTVPFTASKGDANGDLSVNVLDITTIVSYLLNNNPQPFITEAADLNSDGNINVLDIVGVVNKVLYGGLRSSYVAEDQQVSLYIQNDTLFADASTAIGGLQFDISGATSINDVQVLNALKVFESGYSQRDISTLRLLYYSMSGKSITAGTRIPLLKLMKACSLKDVIVSDNTGAAITVSLSDPTIGNRNEQGRTVAELGQNYPNPSKDQTFIPIQIFEKVDEAVIGIYNMLGQQVKVIKLDNPTAGKHEIPWNSLKDKGLFVYKLEIRSGDRVYVSPLKKMIVL